jgi:hypothetical protein
MDRERQSFSTHAFWRITNPKFNFLIFTDMKKKNIKNIDNKYNNYLKKMTAKAMWSVLDEFLANTDLQDSKVTGDDLFFYLKTLRTLDK